MQQWQVWLIAALLLFAAEMLAPGFWLVSIAIGCVAAGAVAALLPGLLAPALSFAGATLLSLVAVRPFLLKHIHAGADPVRTNVDALIGKIGVVSERIEPGTGLGRVKVDGEDWRGAAILDKPIDVGCRIMVVRVEGTTLYVDEEA